jgi:hypothetical protein
MLCKYCLYESESNDESFGAVVYTGKDSVFPEERVVLLDTTMLLKR